MRHPVPSLRCSMKIDRIDYVGRSARRQLRKALDGFERTVDAPRLLSVLAHDGLPKEVRQGATIELRRRYSVAIKNLALQSEFEVLEQLMRDPLECFSEKSAATFAERHRSRCDLWVRLEVKRNLVSEEIASKKCVPWLAIALHNGFVKMRFRTLEDLANAAGSKPPVFREAMYNVGGGSFTVWVGANWVPGENKVHVPDDHVLFEKSYRTLIRPVDADCLICSKFDLENRLQRCDGVGDMGPMLPSELSRLVRKDGCPFFENGFANACVPLVD